MPPRDRNTPGRATWTEPAFSSSSSRPQVWEETVANLPFRQFSFKNKSRRFWPAPEKDNAGASQATLSPLLLAAKPGSVDMSYDFCKLVRNRPSQNKMVLT